jgi:mannose-6-phosphate isomerase-like protein (cupin superfamily)
MRIYNLRDMVGGWFVGNFEPAALQTDTFEVCYKHHKEGEVWDTHYHKEAIEVNLLVKGTMFINDMKIVAGEIFVIPPYYVSAPVFASDCELVVIKTPSIKGDKYVVK